MFALNSNNEIVHIKDALVKTDYRCANCNGILRVKNGKIKAKHFYHLSKDCGDRGESLIHRYWKEYFSKVKEFEGYKIIDSRVEVRLLNGSYIPDIVLKTSEETYLIIEIFYKNKKTSEYIQKFERLSKLEKVYEINVDFDKIIKIKKLYDKDDYRKLEEFKKYILDNFSKHGGLKYESVVHVPYLFPVLDKNVEPEYNYGYNSFTRKNFKYIDKKSLIPKKVKVYLTYHNFKTEPFYIKIYNIWDWDLSHYGELGYLYVEFPKTEYEILICNTK